MAKYVTHMPAVWVLNPVSASWDFYPAGRFEEGTARSPLKSVSDDEIVHLVRALDEAGVIKPRLDDRLRAEDLKITHRLLDIIERNAGKLDVWKATR